MYVGLNSLGLNTAPFAVSPITSLFQNGEPGAVFIAAKPTQDWVTNPNLVTMYQDAAGTTPVTALEQPVGLHLDTRPIFLGPELVADNSFNTGTGWTLDATATISGGNLNISGAPAVVAATNTGGSNLVSGKTYRFSINITSIVGTISFGTTLGADFGNTYTSAGTFSQDFVANSSSQVTLNSRFGGITSATISSISVREVISAPNTVGQPLRGPELWVDANVVFAANSSRVSPGVYRIFSSTGAETADVQVLGATVIGTWYEVRFNIDSVTVAGTGLRVGANGPVIPATVGAKRVIFQADSTTANIKRASTITDIQVSGVSYRAVYGNHRSQATAGARAKVSARYNKITARNANPVDLTNLTLSNATNGLATLTVVNDAAALAAAGLDKLCTLGNVYKLDNSAGDTFAQAQMTLGGLGNTNAHQCFTYWRGTGNANLGLSNTVSGNQALTAGFQPFSITRTPALASNFPVVRAQPGAVVFFIMPDVREQCYSYLPTPQVVWDATTGYDDTGFPARIVYSGAQGYATGAVDFSGSGQAQTIWGGSKLSDAVENDIIELTTNYTATPGTFSFAASLSGGNYFAAVNGAAASQNSAYSIPAAAPSSNVISSLFDVSQATPANQLTLRYNGTTPTKTAIATAGTVAPAMANSPLCYGSRGGAGATNPLTGDEFVSVVRGGATPPTGTVYSVEQAVGRYMGLNI